MLVGLAFLHVGRGQGMETVINLPVHQPVQHHRHYKPADISVPFAYSHSERHASSAEARIAHLHCHKALLKYRT